jgi:adenylate cyclase
MDSPASPTVWLERSDGTRVPIAGNCGLGRASANTVVIPDVLVSRHHATIHAQDEWEYWLIDLGSINGTLLNDRRVVQPQRLKNGDRIAIADCTLTFRQLDEGDPDAGPSDATTVKRSGSKLLEMRQEECWLMLADIEGFTPLSQRLPPAELATLVGEWVGAGRKVVEEQRGAINKYLGDGWLACWRVDAGSPGQVEAVLRTLRARRAERGPKFRVVVHRGLVAMSGPPGLSEATLMGPAINFTFRMEKVAAGLGVAFCFTEAARALLTPALDLEPIPGRHTLKGFPGDYPFFQLTASPCDAPTHCSPSRGQT